MRTIVFLLAAAVCGPALAQMGAGHQPRDSFSNFDTDRDGVITAYEAWKKDIITRFDQMDRDGNGKVTEGEFNAMDAPGIDTGEYPKPPDPGAEWVERAERGYRE